MSFLRSVIADARPRKPMLEPSNGPLAISGWKTHGLDGNASGAEEKSPSAAGQTNRLSKSLPIREGASDFTMGDAPAFQSDDPVNQGIQDMGSNVELESPLSVPVDKSGPIPNDESSIRLDPVNLPEQQIDSEGDKASKAEGSMAPQPAGTVIPNSRMNSLMSQSHDPSITFPETHGAQNRVSGHEETGPVRSPASIRDTSAQEEVAGVIATDDQRYSDGSIKGTETLTIQADATQTTALTLPVKSRQIESSVLEASLVPSVHSPDSFGNSTSDNTAGRNEVEKALADGGKARQVSPSVDKQADMKSLPNQEETPRLQKPDEAKGVFRDGQLVSRRAMAMDSHLSSDMELAAVLQSVDKTVSASAGSPAFGPSKPGSPAQHKARSVKPSASSEALRSVPARPYQADLVPKDGDSFHSKAPLRFPEKRHEAPKVQIGQIDVIIEAAAQPASKPSPSPIDLASRHYLRRL